MDYLEIGRRIKSMLGQQSKWLMRLVMVLIVVAFLLGLGGAAFGSDSVVDQGIEWQRQSAENQPTWAKVWSVRENARSAISNGASEAM